jgi:hypothetical protein
VAWGLRDVLHRLSWHGEAACRDASDVGFFPDERLERAAPGSPTTVLSLLVCAGFPVRRKCLADALQPEHRSAAGEREERSFLR